MRKETNSFKIQKIESSFFFPVKDLVDYYDDDEGEEYSLLFYDFDALKLIATFYGF